MSEIEDIATGTTSTRLPALSMAEFDVLGEHVFCDDQIGIEWREVDSLPDEPVLTRRDKRNEKILRAVALLEEHDQTSSDNAERAEMHRLEGKLDLVLELVTALVRERQGGAELCNARFNARGLCWDSPVELKTGLLIDVDLFVLPQWPLPLRFSARVVDGARSGDGWRICTRLEGLSHTSREWLGKLVFRRHRRTVALQRARG